MKNKKHFLEIGSFPRLWKIWQQRSPKTLNLEENREKCNMKPKQYKDYETGNIVENIRQTRLHLLTFQKAETLRNTRTHFCQNSGRVERFS